MNSNTFRLERGSYYIHEAQPQCQFYHGARKMLTSDAPVFADSADAIGACQSWRHEAPRRPDTLSFPLGRRIAEVCACFLGQALESFHDFRMLIRNIRRFAAVLLQVVEGHAGLLLHIGSRLAAAASWFAAEAAIVVREMQLPFAAAHRLELAAPVKIKRLVRALGAGCAEISGQVSNPSILCSGSGAPASFARVGKMSMVMAGSRQTLPGGILPGQRMMHGSRTPPSQMVALPSRNGPAEPAWFPYDSHGPLSDV